MQGWALGFSVDRLKGFSPEVKSFNFKLLHLILPCRERLNQGVPVTSPICALCTQQEQELILHFFVRCDFNSEAGSFLINLAKVFDPSISEEKTVWFQIKTDALYELPTALMLYCGLELIWKNRLSKK